MPLILRLRPGIPGSGPYLQAQAMSHVGSTDEGDTMNCNNGFNDFWMMAMVGFSRRTSKQIEQTNLLLEKIRRQGLSPAERAAEDAARAAAKAAQARKAAQEMRVCKVA